MAFRVGQKVVCVNNSMASVLSVGAIYTIAEAGAESVGLEEFEGILRGGWLSWRFRPFVEGKLPACITALLDPKNHPPVPLV